MEHKKIRNKTKPKGENKSLGKSFKICKNQRSLLEQIHDRGCSHIHYCHCVHTFVLLLVLALTPADLDELDEELGSIVMLLVLARLLE